MTMNGVPWAVGGGAVVDEGVARMLPYFMFAGQEGIMHSGDCRVKQLSVPGSSVRVSPGAFMIRGRGSGQLYESYLNRITADEIVNINPTGGSSRSDLIILRIEDSHVVGEPWADPADVTAGPYCFPRVIEGVPSSLTKLSTLGNNWSAIPLARIDIPAATGTITDSMIKDLRSLVNPVTGPQPPPIIIYIEDDDCPDNSPSIWADAKTGTGTYGSGSSVLTPTSIGTYRYWPSFADWIVPVPYWATGVDFFFILSSPQYAGNAWGDVRLEWKTSSTTVTSIANMYDVNNAPSPGNVFDVRMPHTIAQTLYIPKAMRGKCVRVRAQARPLANEGSDVNADRGTTAYLQCLFKQKPDLD